MWEPENLELSLNGDSDTIASHKIGAVSLKRYMAGKGRKSNIQGASHYPPE
ncbi:unannotated protein [freshwater metagenome]|uniref:Unannotated protein n=1 Tax=freshwater metagenome TaxID=449393 RepID=A0A6J7SWI5_9ZZZZ